MPLDIIRFVDRISTSPTVRLDLNDGITWGANYDGTDFSPPPLKQAWANTLLADGERLSAAAYANREIQLNLDLIASTPDAVATELQKLWRELDRPSNFLMYQPNGATNPVFFRTFRSSNTKVNEFPSGAIRVVQVTIDAESGGYGPKEQQATVTVINDPASGTNPMYFDITSPKGDLETPLYMAFEGGKVIAQSQLGTPGKVSVVAVRRRGTPSNVPFVLQAEAGTVTVGTSVQRRRSSTEVSGAAPALNANTGFESNTTNWTPANCTLTRDTTQAQSGVASMKLTPTGGQPQAFAECERMPVVSTKRYAGSAWIRSAVTRTVTLNINWYASDGGYISTSAGPETNCTANTWTAIGTSGNGVPPVGAATFTIAPTLNGTPPASNIIWIDEAIASEANYVRVPNAQITPSMNTYFSQPLFPTTASVDARGTYRVFVRYRYQGAGTADDIMARLAWGNNTVNGNVVLPRADNNWVYADLGLVSIPGGYDPVYDGVSGVEIPADGIYVGFQAQDTPGTTTLSDLDLDHLLFVPADDRLLLIRWRTRRWSPQPQDVLLDSKVGQLYSRNASGQPGMLAGHEMTGGMPMITPGVANRIYFVLDVGYYNTLINLMGTTTQITAHYWPRYLTVRPLSS